MQKPLEIEPDAWCAWCGTPLPEPEERLSFQKFCSRACREANRYDLLSNPVRRVSCAWCGGEFRTTDPRKLYCSRRCSREANRPDVPPVPKRRGECEFCGAEFWTHRTNARFCSRTCNNKHRWRTTPDTRDRTKPPPPPRPCIECGQVFQPRRKDRLYCSTSCGNKHRNRRWRAKG